MAETQNYTSYPKISIIVPVYNVKKYLRRCLNSIRVQTFTDFECICIDDGSPDGSGKILDEYAEVDSRFRVIHQENAGVSVKELPLDTLLSMEATEKSLAEYREESMCFLKHILGKNAL